MSELMDLAVKAHGGLDRWNKVKAIKVAASISGAIWYIKGKGNCLTNVVLTAETCNERLTVDYPGQDRRARFEPNRVVTERVDGTLIEARDNPVPSIQVDGETWRRLKITFPDSVKSHTKEQISCFGPDGLLRRHDYTVDILGGATGLNYASDYRDVDGIIVPTKRRVYAYEGDYQIVKEPLLVAIDMGEITLLPSSSYPDASRNEAELASAAK